MKRKPVTISCSIRFAYQFYNAMRMNCHNQSKPFQRKLSYNYSIQKITLIQPPHMHLKKKDRKRDRKKEPIYGYFCPCSVVKQECWQGIILTLLPPNTFMDAY